MQVKKHIIKYGTANPIKNLVGQWSDLDVEHLGIEHLIENYFEWLKEKTILKQVEDCVEITTPFTDRHNDLIQIYFKKNENVLTDDGHTLADLKLSGFLYDNEKHRQVLFGILNGLGIVQSDNELLVSVNQDNFSLKKHNLIQAILAVNSLSYSLQMSSND